MYLSADLFAVRGSVFAGEWFSESNHLSFFPSTELQSNECKKEAGELFVTPHKIKNHLCRGESINIKSSKIMDNLFLVLFLLSITGLVIGVIKPQVVVRWGANKSRKRAALIFGIAALAFFMLFALTTEPNLKTQQPALQQQIQQQEVEKQPTVEDSTSVTVEKEISVTETEKKESGIGVTKESIIDVFEKPDLGFSFSLGASVNGKENYVAHKGGNIIQLLGNADNLSEASIIAVLGSDAEEDLLSLIMVVGFANTIDGNSVDWITNEFQKVTVDLTKSYSNTKVFDEKVFKVSFTPSSLFNSFSLIVTPAQ